MPTVQYASAMAAPPCEGVTWRESGGRQSVFAISNQWSVGGIVTGSANSPKHPSVDVRPSSQSKIAAALNGDDADLHDFSEGDLHLDRPHPVRRLGSTGEGELFEAFGGLLEKIRNSEVAFAFHDAQKGRCSAWVCQQGANSQPTSFQTIPQAQGEGEGKGW